MENQLQRSCIIGTILSLVYGKFMISISRGHHFHSHMTNINHSAVHHNAVFCSLVLMLILYPLLHNLKSASRKICITANSCPIRTGSLLETRSIKQTTHIVHGNQMVASDTLQLLDRKQEMNTVVNEHRGK